MIENILFDFRIDQVGVINNESEFNNVVYEIRYYFIGKTKEIPFDLDDKKERFYVQQIEHSNLNAETFVDIDKITKQDLLFMLKNNISPSNLEQMKQAMYELFKPTTRYIKYEKFKEKYGPNLSTDV